MKKTRVAFVLMLAFCLSIVLAACANDGKDTDEDIIATMSKTSASVEAGQTLALTANVAGAADDAVFSWNSSNTAVATVAGDGKSATVTAVSAGTATIGFLIDNTEYASCAVTVTAKHEIYNLTLNAKTRAIYVDENYTLVPSLTLNGAPVSSPTVSWSTDKAAVAEVTGGVVTGKGEGTAVITASSNGVSATCTVTVSRYIEVAFSKSEMTAFVGEDETIEVTVTANDSLPVSYEVVSLDEAVATVEKEGNIVTITPVGFGEVDIKATSGTGEAICKVVVYKPISTTAEFFAIENDRASWFMLKNDIDFTGVSYKTVAHWNTADGQQGKEGGFEGVLDGNGYTLKNIDLSIDKTYTGSQSVLGVISLNGIVRNLTIDNISGTGLSYVGGLAGVNNGLIENVKVNVGNISATAKHFGGIVSQNRGAVNNCIVDFTNATLATAAGGLSFRTWGTLTDCKVITGGNTNVTTLVTDTNTGVSTRCNLRASVGELYQNDDFAEWDDIWMFDADGTVSPYLNCTPYIDYEGVFVVGVGETRSLITAMPAFGFVAAYELREGEDYLAINETTGAAEGLTVGAAVVRVSLAGTGLYVDVTVSIVNASLVTDINQDIEMALVGESVTITATALLDGNPAAESDIKWESSNTAILTVSETGSVVTVNFEGSGKASVTVKYLNQSVTVAITTFTPITTTAQWLAIAGTGNNAVEWSRNYVLKNDLDFTGVAYNTIAHYSRTNNAAYGITGIIDGNGYALKNINLSSNSEATYTNSRNIFGVVLETAIVRNLNVINIGSTSNEKYSAGMFNVLKGTAENCYVRVGTFNRENGTGGPFGGMVNNMHVNGRIKNCIVDFSAATLVGQGYFGVYGQNGSTSSLSNTHVVTGTDTTVKTLVTKLGLQTAAENCKLVETTTALYAAADFTGWSDVWNFDSEETAMPYLTVDCHGLNG